MGMPVLVSLLVRPYAAGQAAGRNKKGFGSDRASEAFFSRAMGIQVPCDQEDRYFSCSRLRVSMRIPMELSFNLATQFSTSPGTS